MVMHIPWSAETTKEQDHATMGMTVNTYIDKIMKSATKKHKIYPIWKA